MAIKRDIDWEAIRAEYIAGETAKKLSGKYCVGVSTIQHRCHNEKWTRQRVALAEASVADEIKNTDTKDIISKFYRGFAKYVDKLLVMTDALDADTPPKEMSYAGAAYKHAYTMLHLDRTAEDIDEQRARIEQLRAQIKEHESTSEGVRYLLSLERPEDDDAADA